MEGPWKVLKQRETIVPTRDNSGFEKVVEVTFETKAGNVGTVNVPRDRYSADVAREMIDAHAHELDSLAAM